MNDLEYISPADIGHEVAHVLNRRQSLPDGWRLTGVDYYPHDSVNVSFWGFVECGRGEIYWELELPRSDLVRPLAEISVKHIEPMTWRFRH